MLILIAVKGPDRGTVFELAQDQIHLIGRQSDTVRMRDRKLSRRHADIYFSDGAWYIRDVGSTNGTRVNGKRIDSATKLNDGDRIQLGRTIFVVGRLNADAQPLHATAAPELDAAMRLHDSEQDFQFVQDDAAEELDRVVAEEQRASSASRHDALSGSSAAEASRSSAGSRARTHRSDAQQPTRSRVSRRNASSIDRPMRLTNGPIHPKFASVPPSNARAIWALAAGLVIVIGLLGVLHLRLTEQARSLEALTPEAALQEQQRLNQQLIAQSQETQQRIERIASLIQSQADQQTESLNQLQETVIAASATQANANEALVGKVLEELHRLPQMTGDQMAERVAREVRSVLQAQPKPIDDAVMQEVLAELRRRPVEASNNMASQVIQAMRSHAQEQTDALLAAIADQPKADTADVVKQVLAELRAEPQPDTAALAREFAAAVEAQTSRQTAALLEQMQKALAENRPTDDEAAVRELIAALREQKQPSPAELAQQVAAAVEKEYREHNAALLKELRTALATATEQARQSTPTQPAVDTDALVERIADALQAQTESFRDELLAEMRVTLATQPQPVTEQTMKQLLVRVQAQAAEHNQAVLTQLREQLQLENQALLEELLASLQQSSQARLADAGTSRLLSHMRQLPPGPVSLERQRAEQHETFAMRQLGPVSTDSPRSGAALLAAAELFNPEVPGEDKPVQLPNAVSAEAPKVGQEIRTATGLRFIITQAGEGETAQTGDTVLVHYTGYLTDGTVFDSSRTRNKPFGFQLGAGAVIKGWEEGIVGMKQGEKRTLHVPAELAYGSRGAGRSIPPNADLTFEIELLTVIKGNETAAR